MSDNINQTKGGVSFGKIMLASGVGTLIVLILVGLFKLSVVLGLVSSLSKSDDAMKPLHNTFLKLDLTKPMCERSPSELVSYMDHSCVVGFNDLIRSIEAAACDDNIGGIYLYMGSGFPFSWGQSEELREALIDFCGSGKPILAYADAYSQQGYFVASVADSIYLNPSGMVDFKGICAQSLFFKEMLDKLAVKMTLIRPQSNNYKSAGETYTMNHFSDANKEQLREYINSIWDYVVERISEARDIEPDKLEEMADNLGGVMPNGALANNLVDRLCFESDIRETLNTSYNSTHVIELKKYSKTLKNNISTNESIAIIYAEGDVNIGNGYNTAIYSDKLSKAINDAANDDNIKAIVLRVNSPGGMVTASEIITNAVMRAKEKKPLVVSMSDVAASAGYEISCNADYILAQPTTITGSIGVFATLPEIGGTLRRYLGITSDTIKTNKNSSALSILHPLSPEALELMQSNVEDFYKVFVQRVATGRGLDYDYVDSIARGRVWTGRDALKLGLVDALGGLDDAVAIAAERAGIEKYRVIDFPAQENTFSELMNMKDQSAGSIEEKSPYTMKSDGVWMNGNLVVKNLEQICETRGLQARVEFFIINE